MMRILKAMPIRFPSARIRRKPSSASACNDERFPRSEDDEMNFRLTESGGKIYITPTIKSVYYPGIIWRRCSGNISNMVCGRWP